MKFSVVIPAGGAGIRIGGEVPKQFLELHGEPILQRTLKTFAAMEAVEQIAVAVPTAYISHVEAYVLPKKPLIVPGEASRAESVFAALKALPPTTEIVLIHDGIRPFVTEETILAVARAALEHGGAIACTPATDTVKIADTHGNVAQTPDRAAVHLAQTPQGFTYAKILRAYEAAAADSTLAHATDDSALAERAGITVKLVPSPAENIKITTPTDLQLARLL